MVTILQPAFLCIFILYYYTIKRRYQSDISDAKLRDIFSLHFCYGATTLNDSGAQ